MNPRPRAQKDEALTTTPLHSAYLTLLLYISLPLLDDWMDRQKEVQGLKLVSQTRTDRQTDRQPDRHTEVHWLKLASQTDRQPDSQRDRPKEVQGLKLVSQTNRQTDTKRFRG